MISYGNHFQTKQTDQSEPIPGTSQIENSAGGFVWSVDDWKRLDRFLILGAEGGSYYAGEHELVRDNAEAVMRCLQVDGLRAVARIVEISEAGRAPKNDPAIFALAMAAGLGDEKTRKAAYEALPRVARIGTHLFSFVEAAQGFRGWGRGLRKAVGRWYTQRSADALAHQLAKYRQRNGWSHRDVLRLTHPTPPTPAHQAALKWTVAQGEGDDVVLADPHLPRLIADFIRLQRASDAAAAIAVVNGNRELTWEMVPTQFLGEAKIWEALLPNLPMTALLRNLARMTANGLIAPMSTAADLVAAKLGDGEALRKARLHPLAVLGALKTYQQGHGAKGKLAWEPVRKVVDALDAAFYASFGNVEPTGRQNLLALDVSGSMGGDDIAGMPGITPRIGSAAMAMVTARVESKYEFVGFSRELVRLDISPRQRLDDVIETIEKVPMGSTDCSLPMTWALEHRIPVDLFVVYTDSETWVGDIHPKQALDRYRQRMGIAAKSVVVGMVANKFTIADPDDAGMLDVVGFDTATPSILSDFVKG